MIKCYGLNSRLGYYVAIWPFTVISSVNSCPMQGIHPSKAVDLENPQWINLILYGIKEDTRNAAVKSEINEVIKSCNIKIK
jgi:hypothetical protein